MEKFETDNERDSLEEKHSPNPIFLSFYSSNSNLVGN